MSGEHDLGRWEGEIEFYIERGYADDEIEDEFDRQARQGSNVIFTRSGEHVEWGTLHGRRTVLALLATARGHTTARRSRALADPRGRFMEALTALRERDARLTKSAMATEMGIDPGTLNGYVKDGIVPPFPWEKVLEDR
jgi:hypothetical protein